MQSVQSAQKLLARLRKTVNAEMWPHHEVFTFWIFVLVEAPEHEMRLDVPWKLSKYNGYTIEDVLRQQMNKQINLELQAFYTYLSMVIRSTSLQDYFMFQKSILVSVDVLRSRLRGHAWLSQDVQESLQWRIVACHSNDGISQPERSVHLLFPHRKPMRQYSKHLVPAKHDASS